MDKSTPDPGFSRTSTLAVVALVLSVSSVILGPLGFIPGIVCGHIAIWRIRRNPTVLGKRMAVAAVAVGYLFFVLFVAAFLLWHH
jgi:hypothetical protein